MSFRYCNNKSNILTGYKLNLSSLGIIVNSYNATSSYNLDCYGTGIIRGQLTVSGDILYSTNGTSLTTSFNDINSYNLSISGRVHTISGTVNTLSGTVNSLSGLVVSLSGTVNTLSGTVSTLSGTVNTLSGTVNRISGVVDDHKTKLTKKIYPGTLHTVFIGRTSNNYALDFLMVV